MMVLFLMVMGSMSIVYQKETGDAGKKFIPLNKAPSGKFTWDEKKRKNIVREDLAGKSVEKWVEVTWQWLPVARESAGGGSALLSKD